ncbi:MAG: ABC transporter permease [Planctomycetes bacterium]|nr:ABC transporter permease [Planctomycetota bacterium]
MRAILAMALKDLTLLMRDKAGFFFVFFFPLIYAVFFGAIFSGVGGGISALPVALVDEDGSEASERFVRKLEEGSELSVLRTNRDEAVSKVRRGNLVAYILLPDGFEEAKKGILLGEPLSIEVGLDPARKAESGMLQGVVTQYAFQILQDLFIDQDSMKELVRSALDDVKADEKMDPVNRSVLTSFFLAMEVFFGAFPMGEKKAENGLENDEVPETDGPGWMPIEVKFSSVVREVENHPKTSFDITMPQAFVWVFLGCAAAFGISLVVERTRGTLLRLRSAPITLGQILAGKALACFITCMGALIALFVIFYFAFKVRPDSYSLLAFAFVSSALAFVGVMMLISVLGKTEASAGGIGWAILLIMAMLGGGMVPLMMLPEWMKTVSHFSFVKWTVLAMEGAVWRGFTFQEMLLPCGILIGTGVVTFSIGVRLFKVTAD